MTRKQMLLLLLLLPPTIRSGTETQLIYNFRVIQTGAQLTNLKPARSTTSTITMNNIHSQAHTHKQQHQQQQQCLYLLSAIVAAAMMTGSRVGLPLLAFWRGITLQSRTTTTTTTTTATTSAAAAAAATTTLYMSSQQQQ
jgi:hypothetical protein